MKYLRFCRYTILPVVFFFCLFTQAQDATFTENAGHQNSVIIPSEEGHFLLGFLGSGLLETRFIPGVDAGDSLVVQMENGEEDLQLQTSEVADSLSITSEGIVIRIQKEPFEITYNFEQPWINFRSGKKHPSGSSIAVSGREDLIPQLVKSGAIIPVIKEEQEMTDGNLQFHFFYDRNVKQNRLNTCEESYGHEFSECIEITVESGEELLVNIFKEKTSEPSETGEVEVIIHNLDRPVNFVWVNGIKYTGKNYAHEGKLIIPVRFEIREKTEIRVTF